MLEYIYRAIMTVSDLIVNTVMTLVHFIGQILDTSALFPVIVGYLPAFLGGFVMLFFAVRVVYIIIGR